MKESKASILFRHWLKANPLYSCALEMKQTSTNSILFSAITEAQLEYGMAIKSPKGVLLRVQAISEGMPDYIYLREQPAYIVIKYPQSFEIIDIETFILEKKRSSRKSLTSDRAKAISTISISL